jgi:hypothetical protein
MTTVEVDETPVADIPENAVPVRLPVMVVEGMDTADGRFIQPGALTTRVLPITLFAQQKGSHGSLSGDTATWPVGAITEATRRPGPEVTQLSTGEPFPEGTFVWEGRGWMYTDVPAAPHKSAYQLVRDKALRGNSVDLSEVDAEFEYDGDEPEPNRISIMEGVIAATTLVGQPAFPDAYIELDGEAMPLAELAASGTPPWRAADLGDECVPCADPDAQVADEETFALGDDFDPADMPATAAPAHTGGMIALVPDNPAMLTVPGGDPAEQLHLTLAYLGDDVTDWDFELTDAVIGIARELASGSDSPDGMTSPVDSPRPVTLNVFSHAVFNPNGDNGSDPATVYLFDGDADRAAVDMVADGVQSRLRTALGDLRFPKQHWPYVPHVTAGYGVDPGMLTYTGPVTFDRLRLALAGDVHDYPLGGGEPTLIASAAPLPPAEWFDNPQFTEYTPVTVDVDGRAYGHIAPWNSCHIGFAGTCVQPPRSRTAYAYFLVHSTRVINPDGGVDTIPVGYGTIGTGHASSSANAMAAAEHYDNTGTVAFEYNVGEDEHGIWFAGRLVPGLDEITEHRARGTVFSGDWRMIRGNLELVASLGVNTPGFPVPRVRVASGTPVALVAAGAPRHPLGVADPGIPSGETLRELQALLDLTRQQLVVPAIAQALSAVADITDDAARLSFLSALADIELASDTIGAYAKTLHLPPYIKRIEKHLIAKGMSESRAIATAVNVVKKMCATGDTNFPGKQEINIGSRAEACKAVAQWKADRPGAT